ncbi:hypothetical protein LEP1GSC127_3253 [Leptospira kirschneri str. 200801925]|uniref:Uncharacterized protein n=1 Tax=Leptospira kirschneri str. 200802841 TaxID=1193047 RepID=A0A828Y4V0_9LEPT|nr:hypothetical protein LEP1GSC044_1451 [Leptospira kirschneri serovar Grippotyphosa str. RM52]EKO52865.1 hypothetical protein LEP1GSC131_3396 [Leptospira kirschneri str. 200802841]EMN03068.1 hypothetical protein LEP1GSC046_0907 [Leptospira kirschneri serovar Bim str. 1051]EMO77824.1 hypothetical protein LEP1GSC127_3253 [Leptospira kirschneri str. 200801925]EMO82635.1 hypothetical protein LEP1GSC126_2059 [Leptospira kirschneri str. 200801774]
MVFNQCHFRFLFQSTSSLIRERNNGGGFRMDMGDSFNPLPLQ